MKVELERGQVVVRPGELGHFTEWESATLMANGFQRDGEAFTARDDGAGCARYVAETVKKGGAGS